MDIAEDSNDVVNKLHASEGNGEDEQEGRKGDDGVILPSSVHCLDNGIGIQDQGHIDNNELEKLEESPENTDG